MRRFPLGICSLICVSAGVALPPGPVSPTTTNRIVFEPAGSPQRYVGRGLD